MKQKELKVVVGLVCSKLFDLLLSVKTTLPAMLSAMGAPIWALSLIGPIREGGALLPQAWFSAKLSIYQARQLVWSMAIVLKIVLSIAIYILIPYSEITIKTILILLLFSLMSITRAVISLTSKDIQAQNIVKGRRGKVSGLASSISGVFLLCIAIASFYTSFDDAISKAATFCIIACGCLLVGLFTMGRLITHVDTQHGNIFKKSMSKLKFFQALPKKAKQFILVRSLMVNSAIAAPFFIASGDQELIYALPLFMIAQASASMLSAFVWGSLSDRSSIKVMQAAGALSAAFIFTFALSLLFQESLSKILDLKFLYVALFFGLCLGHAGIRQGRKVFMLDEFEEQQRTEFVGVVNSIIGLMLLLFGGAYALMFQFPTAYLLLVMSAFILFACLQCEALKS